MASSNPPAATAQELPNAEWYKTHRGGRNGKNYNKPLGMKGLLLDEAGQQRLNQIELEYIRARNLVARGDLDIKKQRTKDNIFQFVKTRVSKVNPRLYKR